MRIARAENSFHRFFVIFFLFSRLLIEINLIFIIFIALILLLLLLLLVLSAGAVWSLICCGGSASVRLFGSILSNSVLTSHQFTYSFTLHFICYLLVFLFFFGLFNGTCSFTLSLGRNAIFFFATSGTSFCY